MKILYICDEYPPGRSGGIGSLVSSLAVSLSHQGHEVFVVGLYPHGYGGIDYEEQDGVRIWRLRYATDIGLISGQDTLRDKILTHSLRKLGILRLDARRQLRKLFALVSELVATHGIEVIEMPDWNNFYFNVAASDVFIPPLGAPLLVKMHGTLSYFRSEQNLPLPRRMFLKEQALYGQADALAAVSSYTGEYCRRLYKLEQPVTVLYNGVECCSVPERSYTGNTRVVFSGSLFYKKGIFSLMKAWKLVRKALPGAELHIYGKGNDGPLKALLDESDHKSVTFHGHVLREAVLEALRKADVAVYPSYSETFGLAAVEAMSLGCPVIYTSRSCGPEIVSHEEDGLLVDPDQLEDIAAAIINLLNSEALREKLGKAARATVEARFNMRDIAEQHIDIYHKLAARYRQKDI